MDRRAFWLCSGALSAMLVASVWLPYLPTNDGPEGVFAAHVLNHYDDPASAVLRAQLVPSWQFAARGFTLLFRPLELMLGWQAGLRVALALILLVTAWGYVALVHALEPRRWALSLLGFPLALTWPLYMGFFAFAIGSAMGLVTLAVVVESEPRNARRWALVALLLFAQAVAHVFSAAVTGVLILGVTLFRSPRRDRLTRAVHVAVAGLPAAGILVASALTRAPGQVAIAGTFLYPPMRETLALLPRFLSPGPEARALVVMSLVMVFAVVALASAPRARDVDRAFIILGVSLLVLSRSRCQETSPAGSSCRRAFSPTGALLVVATCPVERLASRARVRLRGAVRGRDRLARGLVVLPSEAGHGVLRRDRRAVGS